MDVEVVNAWRCRVRGLGLEAEFVVVVVDGHVVDVADCGLSCGEVLLDSLPLLCW